MNLPDSTEIKKRQNEEENIMMQCASGYYFNIGERTNYICWVFCFLSAAISFKGDQIFGVIAMLALDILTIVAGYIMTWSVKIAADLRELFDARVLFNNNEAFDSLKRQYLKEKALRIISVHKDHYEKISKTNGESNPPGKMDWYTFNKDFSPIYSQLECQRQNKWWNKKMVKIRKIILVIILVTLVGTGIIVFSKVTLSAIGLINAFGIVMFRVHERMRSHFKYHDTSVSIDTLYESASKNISIEKIENLQKYINERRHLPVFEMNIVHRLSATKYTKLYNQI
ncbi:hypothetical protein SAMN04487928_101205 [Butyrivibrio proteoclasticus]|uniref:Uncharacterized protein n=1 Tax=Butyrivibrio proteoclasticus TaxID=43305 RepID=A0A1I5PZD2_9FIRM|nr:S-4TM family putative pore-forming effector [Butyrivibrio proteoclasticus]SFP38986.1 hypothetical protein SAMN04487928_101205 [Butyrivibrio proteoclasticus]